jgi:hypothetical protein
MKLPYPFEFDGELIEEFSVKEATTAAIANAQKRQQAYDTMKCFLQGVLQSLNEQEDETYLKNATLVMPFESAYTALMFGMAQTKEDDRIMGEYRCPQCGTVRKYEPIDGDEDVVDRLADITIALAPLTFTFDFPGVELRNKLNNSVMETVNTLTMTASTLESFARGERRYPDSAIFTQSYAYAQALLTVNGAPVDKQWREKFGEVFFNKLKIKKINEMTQVLGGYSPFRVERVCLKCAHRWTASLDFTNFFAFGGL